MNLISIVLLIFSFLQFREAGRERSQAEAIGERMRRVGKAAAELAVLANKPNTADQEDTVSDWEAFRSAVTDLLDETATPSAEQARILQPVERYLEVLRKKETERRSNN